MAIKSWMGCRMFMDMNIVNKMHRKRQKYQILFQSHLCHVHMEIYEGQYLVHQLSSFKCKNGNLLGFSMRLLTKNASCSQCLLITKFCILVIHLQNCLNSNQEERE